MFEMDYKRFLQQFITMDETWVNHFQPKMWKQTKTVETLRFSSPQKSRISEVRRKDDGLRFLGIKGSAAGGGPPGKGSRYYRGQVCWSLETAMREHQEDLVWAVDKRSALPPGQSSSQLQFTVTTAVIQEWGFLYLFNTHPVHPIWHPQNNSSSPRWRSSLEEAILTVMMMLPLVWITFLGSKMPTSTKKGSVCSTTAVISVKEQTLDMFKADIHNSWT